VATPPMRESIPIKRGGHYPIRGNVLNRGVALSMRGNLPSLRIGHLCLRGVAPLLRGETYPHKGVAAHLYEGRPPPKEDLSPPFCEGQPPHIEGGHPSL
jgi:hypothetical protein